jgi:hypothetical protein
VREEKSLVSEAQGPRPGDSQKAKHAGPRQVQRAVNELLAASQPLLHGFQSASQKRKRGRRIQAAAPAADGRRVRNAIRIFHRWGGAFPTVVLHKTSPQRLTACDQTVMGIRQRESGKETESMFAEFAEAAVVLDPVVTVVMRLLAPPAMTDDRIAQTERTRAKDRFPTSRPVEARLAMIRRKWDKGNRTT